MASQLVRDWFRQNLQEWNALLPADDPLHAPYVETNNQAPDPRNMPRQWTTLAYLQPSIAAAVSIGAPGCKRESGSVDIVVACPAGLAADQPVLDVAEALRVAFREKSERLSINPHCWIRTQVPQPPTTGEDADGRWFFATVSVPFESDSYV